MFLEIEDVLTRDEIGRLKSLAADARFLDGRISSPHSQVKQNLQIDHNDGAYAESSKLMMAALGRNEAFSAFAFPRLLAPPMLAKYVVGMAYGLHCDAAFLPIRGRSLRSDLSCTIFIAGPGDYQGGELSIQLGGRSVAFKGAAGSAVVYPSNTLHEVRPVAAGARLVGLTFIESYIPDTVNRQLLYELDEVAALEGLTMSPENRNRLQLVRNNLRRMWGEAG